MKVRAFLRQLVCCIETQSRFISLQLQLLVDDSARLQETYPGGNAEQISQQQALVVENWGILQEKAAHRREDLQAALEMFRFLASVSVAHFPAFVEKYKRTLL